MKFSPYSYSKISTFKACPFKFKLNYIEGLRLKSESVALEKGTRIHQIIEMYQYNKPSVLPTFDYKVLNKEQQEDAEEIAIKFCSSDMGMSFLHHDYILGHEVEFGMDKKFNPVNYNSNDAMLRGKIDFLAKEKRKAIVVDWKSGKVRDQRYMSNEQTMLYAVWCFNMFDDIDEVESHYVYVEHDTITTFLFKREYFNNYTKLYATHVFNIETTNEQPKIVGPLCNYCDYMKQGYCTPEFK